MEESRVDAVYSDGTSTSDVGGRCAGDGARCMLRSSCVYRIKMPVRGPDARTGATPASATNCAVRGAGLGAAAGLPSVTAAQLCPWDPTADRPAASPLNPFLSDVPSVQLQVYVPRHSPDVATPPPRSAARRPSCVVRRVFDRRSRSGRLSYSYSFFALASTATSATSRALSPMKQRAPVHVGRPW